MTSANNPIWKRTIVGYQAWEHPTASPSKHSLGYTLPIKTPRRNDLLPSKGDLDMATSLDVASVEEARIRAAYAKREKDDFRYSWSNPGHVFMIQERERRFLQLLKRHSFTPLKTKKILEIGCGTGYWLREFVKWGAQPENITGLDLLPELVFEARRLCPEGVTVQQGSAAQLEFSDRTFDLVLQSTVFTSILNPVVRAQVATEMIRVLKDDGLIIWYDFRVNNPRNLDVRGIKKQEIFRLYPKCNVKIERITLAPPLARLIAPYSWFVCQVLECMPCLRTHYIGVIRKSNFSEQVAQH
jgi:ubiquinone/menaquinone biosynthesis C-methylase UbiE